MSIENKMNIEGILNNHVIGGNLVKIPVENINRVKNENLREYLEDTVHQASDGINYGKLSAGTYYNDNNNGILAVFRVDSSRLTEIYIGNPRTKEVIHDLEEGGAKKNYSLPAPASSDPELRDFIENLFLFNDYSNDYIETLRRQ